MGFDTDLTVSFIFSVKPTIVSIAFGACSCQFVSLRHNSTTRFLLFTASIKTLDKQEDFSKQNTKTFVSKPEYT